MPKRFCVECRALGEWATTRCTNCQAKATKRRNARANTTQRGLGAAHRAKAKAILAKATVCYWCGKPFTEQDPATADHLTPRAQGGQNSQLVAAHRSCNSRRGAQQRKRQ